MLDLPDKQESPGEGCIESMQSAFKERPTWPNEGSKEREFVQFETRSRGLLSIQLNDSARVGQQTSMTFLVLIWPIHRLSERLVRLTDVGRVHAPQGLANTNPAETG